MKSLYLLFLMVFVIFFNLTGLAQKKAYISKASIQPVVDGEKEAVWNEATGYLIDYNYSGTISGASDLSAKWYGLWDDNNIYFLAEVTDDILKNSGSNAEKFWIHDCFEIFFDILNGKNNISTGDNPDDDKHQYRFIYNLDNEPIYEKPPTTGMLNVSKRTDKGYLIEIKLPWSTLIGNFPFGDVIIGRTIGAEFQIADLDNQPLEWMPDANVLWNNQTGTDLKRAANFGTLILTNNNLADVTAPAKVTDLTTNALGAIEVELNWTSQGDDNNIGLAEKYEIRYSTNEITEQNWNAATLAKETILPLISGTKQKLTVKGLTGGTSYFFALKTLDEANNASVISNLASAITAPADLIAPAAIKDLSIETARPISIKITWKAPGDDNNSGQALYYDIRYSTASITDANWNNAKQPDGIPVPLEAGTQQSIIIIGLLPETQYYFAIKTTDEQKNTSAISNIAVAKTSVFVISSKTSMDQFIGTNAFIDDPLERMNACGYIREYHPWGWDEGDIATGNTSKKYEGFPNNKNAWEPSTAAGGNYWFFDTYYKKLYEAGITVVPCVFQSPAWLSPNNDFQSNKIPVKAGLEASDAKSYVEKADHMFQYAARYGSTKVADNLLKLADNQLRVSGLGYIKYIENWNEPDGWWRPRDQNFSAEEVAAMGSADYDGHCGEMGSTFGVKNADKNMKLVMGGLAVASIDYIEKIRQWCIKYRKDKAFAFDVINVHHYTNHENSEQGGLKKLIQSIVDYRDQYLPDVEVWITEFGWDSGNNETKYTPKAINGVDREEIQAQWIARTYLLLASTGIERAAQFMLRDVYNNGKVDFETCGMVNQKNDWKPKKSWYYTYTMKNTLKGMFFTGEQNSLNKDILVYKFENVNRDTLIYAVWCPTSNATVVNNYQLNLLNDAASVKLIELKDGKTEGTSSELIIKRNTVTFNVSELPVFVVTTKNTKPTSIQNEVFQTNQVVVYPNPAGEKLGIQINSQKAITNFKISILNLCGQVVQENNLNQNVNNIDFQLNISNLQPGMYFIKIQAGNINHVKQFIKK